MRETEISNVIMDSLHSLLDSTEMHKLAHIF